MPPTHLRRSDSLWYRNVTQIDDLYKTNERLDVACRLINETNWIFYFLGKTIINWIRGSKMIARSRAAKWMPLFRFAQLLPFDISMSSNEWTNECRGKKIRGSFDWQYDLWPFPGRGHFTLIRWSWFMNCPRNSFYDRIGSCIRYANFKRVDMRLFGKIPTNKLTVTMSSSYAS